VNTRIQIGALFPQPLHWCDNILELNLSGINGVIHPTTLLMNAGRSESTGGDYFFYREAMSQPSVMNLISAVDKERLAIAAAYGVKAVDVLTTFNRNYGTNYPDFETFAINSKAHNLEREAPKNLSHRHIAQDVPYLLVPWYDLGTVAGVQMPAIKTVITLAGIVTGMDYLATGRTLAKLGLAGADMQAILKAFDVVPAA